MSSRNSITGSRTVERNGPCPCGSGLKFKKCCLPLHLQRKRWDPLESELRGMIQDFFDTERFLGDLQEAARLYGIDITEEKRSQSEQRLFYDWYVHDFTLPRENQSIIRVFLRECGDKLEQTDRWKRGGGGERLDATEAKTTLASWADSSFRFLEVQNVRKGVGFEVTEVLDASRRYFVFDVSGSHAAAKYDIVFARPYKVGPIVRLASGVMLLPQLSKSDIEGYLRKELGRYGAQQPSGEGSEGGAQRQDFLDSFLRAKSLDVITYLKEVLSKPPPPIYVTPEGDPVVFSSCEYKLRDCDAAERLLERASEFRYLGEAEEEGGGERFDWVSSISGSEDKKGGQNFVEGDAPAELPQAAPKFQLQTLLTDVEDGSVARSLLVLGNLTLKRDSKELAISCTSDQRLQSCKKALDGMLGDLVLTRSADRYDEIGPIRQGSATGGEDEEEVPEEIRERIATEFFNEYYDRWLATKIPSLGGMTPVEASKSEQGRRRLEEILKIMENQAERSHGELRPPVESVRAKLGLRKRE